MALSAYARTLVVGAPGVGESGSGKTGYVKVYRFWADEDGWKRTQLGQTIFGNATGDRFGYSADISTGKVIVLGSPGSWEFNDRPGYVQVFYLDSDDAAGTTGTWKQVGQDIAGEAIGDEFGWSVSISDDGKTIAVGADMNNGKNGEDSGQVRIYRLADEGMSWEQIGEDIDGEWIKDYSGYSVSLSANGTIVAIGAPQGICGIDALWPGQVKVYRLDSGGSSWDQLGESICGDNADDWFGNSVDISPDGNSLAVGSPGSSADDRPGYVKVFDLGTDSWKQVGQTITGKANGDGFGWTVSLSDDAKTLAVSAPFTNRKDGGDDTGHVAVYRMDDSESGWKQKGKDIDGEAAYDYSGDSVSLSADGNTVAIGSGWNDDNGDKSGHVRVFVMK